MKIYLNYQDLLHGKEILLQFFQVFTFLTWCKKQKNCTNLSLVYLISQLTLSCLSDLGLYWYFREAHMSRVLLPADHVNPSQDFCLTGSFQCTQTLRYRNIIFRINNMAELLLTVGSDAKVSTNSHWTEDLLQIQITKFND